MIISSTTGSTSTNTGALIVLGGMGVGGTLSFAQIGQGGGAGGALNGFALTNGCSATANSQTLSSLVLGGYLTSTASRNAITVYNIYNVPNLNSWAGTGANYYGLYNTSYMNGGGSFVNWYGGYFDSPNQGGSPVTITNSTIPLFAKSQAIGYTATTPPTNGLIVSGNVGIKNNSPSYELDVTGTMRATTIIGTNFTLPANQSITNLTTTNHTGINNFLTNVTTNTLTGTNAYLNSVYLNTPGGTSTSLDYYEENSFLLTAIGLWGTNPTGTGKIVRVGKSVCLSIPAIYATSNTGASSFSLGNIPSRFMPTQYLPFSRTARVVNNYQNQLGDVYVGGFTNGMDVYADISHTSLFSGGNAGIENTNISWIL
jgi:hypothetical protein